MQQILCEAASRQGCSTTPDIDKETKVAETVPSWGSQTRKSLKWIQV